MRRNRQSSIMPPSGSKPAASSKSRLKSCCSFSKNRRLQFTTLILLLVAVAVLLSMGNIVRATQFYSTNDIPTLFSDIPYYQILSSPRKESLSDNEVFEMSPTSGTKETDLPVNVSTTISKDNRPWLILHLGPPKTGSTTIQSYLIRDHQDGVLAKSNFTNVNCRNIRSVYKSTNITDWSGFSRCLDAVKGKNAIYSNEVFGKFFGNDQSYFDNLKALTKSWRVKLVFSYRRLFEWLPSFSYQQKKYKVGWRRGAGQQVIMTFPQYFRIVSKDNLDRFAPLGEKHPTQFLVDKFAPHFDDIDIFNMHDKSYGTNLVANFYCSVFPADNNGACEFRRKRGIDLTANVRKSLSYYLLAYAAKEEGLLEKKWDKDEVVSAIKHRQENILNMTADDFQCLECLSTEEETWFLNKSLEFERLLLPQWFKSPGGEAEHRAKFESAIKRNNFCDVNAMKMMQEDEGWRSFFLALKKTA